MLVLALILLPIVALIPVWIRIFSHRGSRRNKRSTVRKRISVYLRGLCGQWRRCLCILLAYVFLLGPESFQTLAQADVAYSSLGTSTWGADDDTISYTYDANGSLETRTKAHDSITTETVLYEYDLRHRLTTIKTTPHDANGDPEDTSNLVEYTYNPQGIRVGKRVWTETSGVSNNDDIVTTYLVDPYNPTGYAQVLEETRYDSTPTPLTRIQYTLGEDVISQTESTYTGGSFVVNNTIRQYDEAVDTMYLLCDGLGSVRQMRRFYRDDSTTYDFQHQGGYSYDAYGVLLQDSSAEAGVTPAQETNLLYAGEYFDADAQHYYNRARWYNPYLGRFNRTDPFAGSPSDPQSLHKYLYAHCNPVNNVDPMGLWTLGEVSLSQKIIAVAIGALAPAIITGYESARAGLGWGQIIANSALAWAIAFGFGVGMIFIGPAICKTIVSMLTKIPGVTIGMAKTALMVVGYGMLAYGMLALWTSDYPLAVKISVTVVVALSIIVAICRPGKTGGRLGGGSTRDQNKQIARELRKRNYRITGGGGEEPEEYLRGPGGGRKGSNWVDITAKHKETGRVIRINTVSTRADGFTPTKSELNAATSIRSKLPPGEHLILIPKNKG